MRKLSALVLVLLGSTLSGWTQQSANASAPCCDAIEQHMKDMEDRLILLEGQVRLLKEQLAQTQATGAAAGAETGAGAATPTASQVAPTAAGEGGAQLPVYGGASAAAKALNPDISVIGDFIGAAGHYPTPPGSLIRQAGFQSLTMHESEVGFQAIIDPYARGDFFLSFGESGVDLEEGYITFTALPAGFVARVGKMRAAFGKVNAMHNHVLPWVDRPLVNENLVGGEDGIDDAGFSIQRILPAPKGIFLEATGQVFRGDTGEQTFFLPNAGTIQQTVFTATNKSDVSTVEHLRAYRDITESTNLDLGLSYARGHNELGSNFLTQLYGIDATLRWKPLRRSIYHSFIGRTEAIWSQRQQPLSLGGEQRSFGMYASGDYQFARRWFLGGRYDYAQRARDDRQLDRGAAATLTYWPSEFSQIRGQYRFTRYAEGINANELLMQVQFSLGAHGAHPF
ncbi:MAG TPA: hypothetical protein VMT05_08590 [Terriglobales bacterium]|jgi:hypothetical protein|nr:hypothetical protein [Terriglobales bacterium]